MSKLLTLKHYQLFLLMVGLPVIIECFLMGRAILSRNMNAMFPGFFIMMTIFLIFFVGWFYSLGANLFKRLPATAKMSLTKFKVFLFVYVAYILFILVYMIDVFMTIALDGRPNPVIFFYILPLHLFSMFCIFYCLYFNAKALRTIELQRPVTFSDYAGEFLLLWFFPVGIWVIQPRINKLFEPAGDH